VLLGNILALLGRSGTAHLTSGRYARWHHLLDICVLANLLVHRTASLGVDVLLDLFGLSLLFKLADLLLFVVANLPLLGVGNTLA
jgi:hypothetical protein